MVLPSLRRLAIPPHAIARYVAELDRDGVKGWTQRGRLTVLSAVFTYARERLDHPGGNPSSLLSKAERPGVDDQREHRILTQQEVEAMLAAADEHHACCWPRPCRPAPVRPRCSG